MGLLLDTDARADRLVAGRAIVANGGGLSPNRGGRHDGAMQTGRSATREFDVTEADTASALGSGDLPVLATPRLLAWCEAVTCAVVADDLEPSRTTVGTRVSLEHLAASPVGERLRVEAGVSHVDGRLLRFAVAASHTSDGRVVGSAEVTRVIVDRERFMERVSPSGPA